MIKPTFLYLFSIALFLVTGIDLHGQTIDLELSITVSDLEPNVGDNVTYTIELSNEGQDQATNVGVEAEIPSGLASIINISNGGLYVNSYIEWEGLEIPAGESVSLTYEATVEAPLAGVDYLNIAQVTFTEQLDPDSEPNNDDGDQSEDDEDNVEFDSVQEIDLALVKTVNDSEPNSGDMVTYTIECDNSGPSEATGVAIEDIIPSGLSSITNISNGGTLISGVIQWEGLAIPSGESLSLTYNAMVQSAGSGVDFMNVAQVTEADQYDIDSAPNNDDGDQSEDDEDRITLVVGSPNDIDNDGVNNNMDNCPNDPNPDQADIDGDGVGDICDSSNDVNAIAGFEDFIYVSEPVTGIIMKSPSGICYALTVNDDGTLSSVEVVCPD